MTRFPNDALEAARCHGDLSMQLCANTPDTVIHALRDMVKNLPDLLVLRWTQAGSVPVLPVVAGRPPESARNFLGFRDGSANPDSADAALMDRLVWVQPRPGRARLGQQTAAIRWSGSSATSSSAGTARRCASRSGSSGARRRAARRLGGGTEADVPDYAADPEGKVDAAGRAYPPGQSAHAGSARRT